MNLTHRRRSMVTLQKSWRARSASNLDIPNAVYQSVRQRRGAFPLQPAVRRQHMKLTVRGEYVLRALVVLGMNHSHGVVPVRTIAQQQNIPQRFLEQILNDLKSAGIVESRRGVAGGYRLNRPPENITLASVIRHIEGPLAPVSCVSERFYERCSCPDEAKCGIRSVMKEVRDAIVSILDRMTVADLCDRVRKLQGQHLNPFDYVI